MYPPCLECRGTGRMSAAAWAWRFAGGAGPAGLFFGGVLALGLNGGRMPLGGNAGLVAWGILLLLGYWLFACLGIVQTIYASLEAVRLLRGKGLPDCPHCMGLGY